MESLKQEAIKVISKLPDTAGIDDIMYKLYVVAKINRGRQDMLNGNTISLAKLKSEIKSW